MRYFLGIVCFFITQSAFAGKNCPEPQPSWWQKGWAITIFSGPLTSQTSSKIIRDADFGDSGVIALAGAKKLGSVWDDQLDFEYEGQAVQHFGEQTHFELNPIVIVARWKSFPWNDSLPTTFAIGDGLSIATQKPKLEKKRRRDESAKTLNFVMAELTFSLPSSPEWAFVLRYHHRSGMFGAFHGVHDASTVLAAGIKYWF